MDQPGNGHVIRQNLIDSWGKPSTNTLRQNHGVDATDS
jgi:hypothetical protein